MSSNVGSSLFIGLAGQAAVGGLAVGGYEWNVRMFISKKHLFSPPCLCNCVILLAAYLQTKGGEISLW